MRKKRFYVSGIVVNETTDRRAPGVFHDIYRAEDEEGAIQLCLDALMTDLSRAGIGKVSILAHDVMEVPETDDGEMMYGVSLLMARDLNEEHGTCNGLSLACGFVIACDDEEEAVEMSKNHLRERNGDSMTRDNIVIHSGHALAVMPEGAVLQ